LSARVVLLSENSSTDSPSLNSMSANSWHNCWAFRTHPLYADADGLHGFPSLPFRLVPGKCAPHVIGDGAK
jgi:hypothetical protein